MKTHVDLEHVQRVGGVKTVGHHIDDAADFGDVLIGGTLAGQFARQLFHGQQHLDLVGHLFDRRNRHDGAARRAQVDQTFLGQDAHRFTQRCAADPHFAGVVAFLDAGAGCQFSAQDVAAQLVCDLLG